MKTKEPKKNFRQALREGLELIHESIFYNLTLHDEEYQKSLSEFGKAEREYMRIQDELEIKYGCIIDNYLSALQVNNCDANDLCYISGLIDMYRFLNSYSFLNGQSQNKYGGSGYVPMSLS